jgi:predicted phage tail protein
VELEFDHQPDADEWCVTVAGCDQDGIDIEHPVLWGAGGGGKAASPGEGPRESPNDLQSRARARFVELLGEGEIVGLYNGGQSIFFGDTPYLSEQGEENYTGVSYTFRYGLPVQSAVPEASQLESVLPTAFTITTTTPFTVSILPGEADSVRVTLHVDILFQVQDDGDVRPYHVEFAFYRRAVGSDWEFLDTYSIQGKTQSPYEVEVRIVGPGRDLNWEVRVERWTVDDTDAKKQSGSSIPRITKIIEERLTYPHSALIGIEIDAQKFGGSIPARSYEVLGLKIKVPSNYDSIARQYTGIWDGTFKIAWTNNPAWIFYDLISNDRYGLGRYLNVDRLLIDKWTLYEIGRYCDEMVKDDEGGLEPRFTLNTVIHDAGDAYDVLNSVSSAFRGMIYWASGAVTAVQDSPRSTKKIFTTANVESGLFNYTGTELKSRHTVAFVRWNDPKKGYKQTVEPVEDQPRVAKYGWNPMDVNAYGCTSRSQARRFGLWMIDTEWSQTQTVHFTAGKYAEDLMPGDVFAVSDPQIGGPRMGGRIVSVDGQRVTIDAPVPIETGYAYSILISTAEGQLEEIRFDAGNDPADVLLLRNASQDPIMPGMNFLVTAEVLVPRLFAALTVTPAEGGRYDVTGLFYDPDKYDRVEKGVVKPPPNYVITQGILPPENLKMTSVVRIQPGGLIRGDVSLSWSPPGSMSDPALFFEVGYKHDTDPPWTDLPRTSAVVLDLGDLVTGTYHFRIRSVNALGQVSSWATLDGVVSGTDAPPGNVINFTLTSVGEQLILAWDPVTDLDLSYYQVRYTANVNNPAWTGAQTLIPRVPAQTTTHDPAAVGRRVPDQGLRLRRARIGSRRDREDRPERRSSTSTSSSRWAWARPGPAPRTGSRSSASDLRLVESFKTYPTGTGEFT